MSYCDACASGGDITTCQQDAFETIVDVCGQHITYCTKYKDLDDKK